MNYTCTATKVWDATNINNLKGHATADTKHPLCSQKLNVITYGPSDEANTQNVDCKNCLKKLPAS